MTLGFNTCSPLSSCTSTWRGNYARLAIPPCHAPTRLLLHLRCHHDDLPTLMLSTQHTPHTCGKGGSRGWCRGWCFCCCCWLAPGWSRASSCWLLWRGQVGGQLLRNGLALSSAQLPVAPLRHCPPQPLRARLVGVGLQGGGAGRMLRVLAVCVLVC